MLDAVFAGRPCRQHASSFSLVSLEAVGAGLSTEMPSPDDAVIERERRALVSAALRALAQTSRELLQEGLQRPPRRQTSHVAGTSAVPPCRSNWFKALRQPGLCGRSQPWDICVERKRR